MCGQKQAMEPVWHATCRCGGRGRDKRGGPATCEWRREVRAGEDDMAPAASDPAAAWWGTRLPLARPCVISHGTPSHSSPSAAFCFYLPHIPRKKKEEKNPQKIIWIKISTLKKMRDGIFLPHLSPHTPPPPPQLPSPHIMAVSYASYKTCLYFEITSRGRGRGEVWGAVNPQEATRLLTELSIDCCSNSLALVDASVLAGIIILCSRVACSPLTSIFLKEWLRIMDL